MKKQYILTSNILIDYREKFLIAKLQNRLNINISNIPIDIIIGDIAIERKSIEDFEQSIIDGRLFQQLEILKEYRVGLLALELGLPERIHINSYYGALAKIARAGLSIINYRNLDELVEIIFNMAKEHSEERKYIVRKKEGDPIINILGAFPGIGEKRIEKIVRNYHSLKDFINSDLAKLKNVLGEKLAEKVYEIINSKIIKDNG